MTVSLKYVTYLPMYYMTLPIAGVTYTRNSCLFVFFVDVFCCFLFNAGAI